VVAVVLLEGGGKKGVLFKSARKKKSLRLMERTSTPLIEPAKYILQD